MRPDEHKKKKSAQYQRKHGGSSAKGAKNENEKSTSKPGKQGPSRSEGAPHTRYDSKAKIDSSSESEEEGEQTETKAKTFRRREIASNWAKYDLPPADADDVAATPRGQDFHKLLQSAGGAVSHFRFKDEESWEEGNSESGPAAQVLSLDCAELATSLNCLPLYTQLGLGTDIFTSEQLTAMNKTAEENRKLAGLPDPSPKMEQNSVTFSSKPTSTSSCPTPPTVSCGSSEHTLSSVLPGSRNKGEKGANRKQNKVEEYKGTNAKKGSAKGMSVKNDPSCSGGFTDADLDGLLDGDDVDDQPRGKGDMARSSGAEVRVKSSEGQASSKQASAGSQEVTEQDLDDLLAMESPQCSQSITTTKTDPKMNESKMAAESAELEDWLDSVLDD